MSNPNPRAQVEKIRDQLSALRHQRRQVERELPDRTAVFAAIEKWEADAEAVLDGMVDVRTLLRADGRPVVSSRLDLARAASAMAVRELADRHRDAVDAEFEKRGANGLTATARSARLAEIDAQLLAAEKAEEGAIRAAEADGMAILRRADASPAIVLAFDRDLA